MFRAAAPSRPSLTSRTVAVVQELKVVSPPARPVASAACHSRPSQPAREAEGDPDDEAARDIDQQRGPRPVQRRRRRAGRPDGPPRNRDGRTSCRRNQQGARHTEDSHQYRAVTDGPEPSGQPIAVPARQPPAAAAQAQQHGEHKVGKPHGAAPARASWSTEKTTAENVVKEPSSPGPRPARSQKAVCGRAIHRVVRAARTKLPATLIPRVVHGTAPAASGNAARARNAVRYPPARPQPRPARRASPRRHSATSSCSVRAPAVRQSGVRPGCNRRGGGRCAPTARR